MPKAHDTHGFAQAPENNVTVLTPPNVTLCCPSDHMYAHPPRSPHPSSPPILPTHLLLTISSAKMPFKWLLYNDTIHLRPTIWYSRRDAP